MFLFQDSNEEDLHDLFSHFVGVVGSPVESVTLLSDRETGRHRGFAFVSFGAGGEGAAAATAACKKRFFSLKGRQIEVTVVT